MIDDDVSRLKAAYREQGKALCDIRTAFDPDAKAEVERQLDRMRGKLRAFYLAAGHDLTELTSFFQQVDQEIADMLPK